MAEVKRQTKPPIIEVKDFDFYYNGGSKKVLKDINMKIKEKTVTAFIGPSGCGKSTLLRSINRMNDLVPNIVVDGELFFNEKNIYDPWCWCHEVAYWHWNGVPKSEPVPDVDLW
jgi:ABC-type phosphate transport system ATPase subunit